MKIYDRFDDERGFALLLVLLLTMVVGALALSAVSLAGNASLVNAHAERQAKMEAASMAGTELGRALVNRSTALYPETGYVVLPADSMTFQDALGHPITGFARTVYAGPSGVPTGQFGVFGSVVSVVEDAHGTRSIFRREMVQESFAKYAYFTDKETTISNSPIYFAPGDQLFGPVHSNDYIRIMQTSGGPVFHGPVTTHRKVVDAHRAQFRQGKQEGVGKIKLPDLTELSKLLVHAQAGNTAINSSTVGNPGEATTRIEFVAIDIDGDGNVTGENEGFFKVYKSKSANSAGARWVSASRTWPQDEIPNCGHRHTISGKQYFYSAPLHDTSANDAEGKSLEGNSTSVLKNQSSHHRARCYLGGSDSLSTNLAFQANDGRGAWQTWSGAWATAMPAAISNRADAAYLVPMGRLYNPNFKGVIHVAGHVAISGTVRGRLTLATTGDIVIADDVQYATDPAAASCQDILGLFAGGDIVVSDNSVNAPMNLNGYGNDWRTYDDTSDEIIHGVLLTLGSFTVANYDSGADDYEGCEGSDVGRGCLYITGGIIQDRRGPVGQSAWKGATGYLKRYSYDQCAAISPPPYYPTTGYFARGRIFEVNPVGFDVAEFFDQITAG
jgi:hypothetical protein